MAGAPSYRKPPVHEALIDIRIDPISADHLQRLEDLHKKLIKEYPNKKVRRRFSGTVQIEATTVVRLPVESGILGYWFQSQDQRRLVQVRLDGFTYNRIKPDPHEEWPGWNKMRDEAKEAWKLYAEALNLSEFTRLAVRYINTIAIPVSPIELYDYFTAPPRIPPDLPYQDMLDFSSSVTISFPAHKAIAVVKHAPAPQPYPGTISVILDIDVFRNERATLSTFPMWETLDQLRDLKNEIFEASLLPRTKELSK